MSIQQLIEKYKTAKQTLADEVSAEFSKMFVGFFDKHPEAFQIRFTAYAPYFNDGEPCEYTSHADYAQLFLTAEANEDFEFETGPDADDPEDQYDYYLDDAFSDEEGLSDSWPHKGEGWPSLELYNDFRTLMAEVQSIPDEILEQSFGDGLFTIDRKGVKVTEYDHE